MQSSLTHVSTFFALLLLGTAIHFLIMWGVSVGSSSWWLEFPRWGFYAAEYIAFAAWLAWGPPSFLSRVATVSLFGLAWMSASWAAVWVAEPDYFAAFGKERLQVFTLVPLSLLLGTLPLLLMRRWCRCVAMSASVSSGKRMQLAFALIVMSIGMMVIAAHRFRGPDLRGDVFIAGLVAMVLGAIAAATAPLLSWGFLGHSIRPSFILLAWLPPVPLALLASRFFGGPGPGGNAAYATPESVVASLVAIGCLCLTFLWWRVAGLRLLSHTVAEPGVGADSR